MPPAGQGGESPSPLNTAQGRLIQEPLKRVGPHIHSLNGAFSWGPWVRTAWGRCQVSPASYVSGQSPPTAARTEGARATRPTPRPGQHSHPTPPGHHLVPGA